MGLETRVEIHHMWTRMGLESSGGGFSTVEKEGGSDN